MVSTLYRVIWKARKVTFGEEESGQESSKKQFRQIELQLGRLEDLKEDLVSSHFHAQSTTPLVCPTSVNGWPHLGFFLSSTLTMQ